MCVVDVVARTVGEHGVDEMHLDFGCEDRLAEKSARVLSRRLVFEVPAHLPPHLGDVGVDEHGRANGRIGVRRVDLDAVLGLDAEDLGYGHYDRTLPDRLS